MWNEIIYFGVSVGAATLLLVVSFFPVAWLLFRDAPWPKILLSAAVIGTCLQSITGMLWTHFVGSFPVGEVILLSLLWAALLLLAHHLGTPLHSWDQRADSGNHFFLVIILIGALVVRILHPLEVAYLGQSDAYTHLHYLRNIVEKAYLPNPSYPPGYHWVVALPVLVFSIDPFIMVRFVGALFGAALVLAVYVLLLQSFDKRAALFGSFFAAGFPPMLLLMKTGIGAFANQMGLFLVPVVLLFYLELINKHDGFGNTMVMLLLALVGLVAATPAMIFHLLIVLAFERTLAIFRTPRSWLAHTARIGLAVVAALGILIFHFSQVGPGQRAQVSRMMVGPGEQTQQVERFSPKIERTVSETDFHHVKKFTTFVTKSPYFLLFVDYFSIKRHGLGSNLYDTLAGLLSVLFVLCLGFGLWKGLNQYTLIGLWGLLTTLETATGLLQFSSYQREGWSLLIAVCCLGGIISARIYEAGARIALVRYGTVLLLAGSFAWTIIHPPRHPIRSSAEDPLVRSVRFAGKSYNEMESGCRVTSSTLCDLVPLLSDSLPLTIVTRRFSPWGRSQGEIAPNVLQPWSEREVLIISDEPLEKALRPRNQYLVLVDKISEVSSEKISKAFRMITPSMVEGSLREQGKLFEINHDILNSIDNLSVDDWLVKEVSLSDTLIGIVIVPRET